SLFVPADDVDPRSQGALGSGQEFARIGRNAKGIGRHRSYRRRMNAGQAFAKPGETGQRQLHRRRAEASMPVDAGAEAQGLAPRVLPIDLVALDPADLQPEAVRSEVDDGKRLGGHGLGLFTPASGATKSSARSLTEIRACEPRQLWVHTCFCYARCLVHASFRTVPI